MLEDVSAGFRLLRMGLLHNRLLSLCHGLETLRRHVSWFPRLQGAASLFALSAEQGPQRDVGTYSVFTVFSR